MLISSPRLVRQPRHLNRLEEVIGGEMRATCCPELLAMGLVGVQRNNAFLRERFCCPLLLGHWLILSTRRSDWWQCRLRKVTVVSFACCCWMLPICSFIKSFELPSCLLIFLSSRQSLMSGSATIFSQACKHVCWKWKLCSGESCGSSAVSAGRVNMLLYI